MKKVDYYIDTIKEELCGAKEYAECYVYYKSTHPEWAKLYHDMAIAELTHASNLKTIGTAEYEQIAKTYMPESEKEKWEHCIKKYADKVAYIKTMLSM